MSLRAFPLVLLLVLLVLSVRAAHLPAVRRASSAAHDHPELDEKRALASRLLRTADRHKDRSLRDVLGDRVSSHTARDAARRTARAERKEDEDAGPGSGDNPRAGKPGPTGYPHGEDGSVRISTMSHLFAWAINSTVYGAAATYSGTVSAPEPGAHDEPPSGDYSNTGRVEVDVTDLHEDVRDPHEHEEDREPHGQAPRVAGRPALPPGSSSPSSHRKPRGGGGRPCGGARDGPCGPGAAATAVEYELLSSSTESEFDVLRRNVHLLHAEGAPPSKTVHALQVVEELCHSIDNGRDLQVSGGLAPLLSALSSRHDQVRATAAWALATCCQNNPPVQNASLALGAVPRLARLAVRDGSAAVRSRALFALNALLELENARIAFEELPYAVKVVQRALLDSSDHRATRRALNLTELLVQKNLDAWKTQLEAWDIPVLIERLMRSHDNSDVRESAARTIAALDGRLVA